MVLAKPKSILNILSVFILFTKEASVLVGQEEC